MLIAYLELKLLVPLIRLVQILVVALSSIPLGSKEYPAQASVTDGQSFDFVVVGAGTAGCVLASRLSEVANWTVLLVEAGDDPPSVTENPLLSILALPSMPDWDYYGEDDKYASQARRTKTVQHFKGKMIGGSSSLNYMFHVRGNKADYDGWAAQGNLGWDWENVRKYFDGIERAEGRLRSKVRGHKGHIGVTSPPWRHRTSEYLKGFVENGHTILEDYNGDQQMGYSAAQFAISNGIRQSAAESYLKPAKDRPNLHILKKTQVKKVLFDSNNRAIGVEATTQTGQITITARKEIILSAGTVNSPQLLMLSGIGPRQHLKEMGIKIVHRSENVGENLQDHMMVHVILTGKDGFSSVVNNADLLRSWGNFPIPTLIGFAAVNKSQTHPDYQTTVCPLAAGHLMALLFCRQVFDLDDEVCTKHIDTGNRGETLHALITILNPKSRGRVMLRSNNAEDKPIILNGYFSNYEDLENLAKYVEDYVSVVNTRTFKRFDSKIVDPGIKQCRQLEFGSREYWICYILNTVSSHFHLVGTCAMGPEGMGVVDERLRVRGVQGLRVVDASVMPTITSGNTNAPVLMIAEKATDMIKKDHEVEQGLCSVADYESAVRMVAKDGVETCRHRA